MSLSRILVALAILSTLSGLIHRYLWARLVRDAAWPGQWPVVLTVSLCVLGLLIPAALFLARILPRSAAAPFAWVAFTWMGLAFYLLLVCAASDLGLLAGRMADLLPQDPERRVALARVTAALIAGISGAIGAYGVANAVRGFDLKRVRIPLARLPKSASGYKIVQLTDVHVGPTIGRSFIETLVARTNALEPDLVAITGDLVDGTVDQLGDLVAPLKDLRARDGVFFVTGNHEYYSGADEWVAHLGTLGVRVLRNERVPIRDAFDLAGVDDASAHRMLAHHGQDVPGAMRGRDPSRAVVLLAHQPKAIDQAAAEGVDLQLSGHVHGGQMAPFNWLVRLEQPFVSGLHRLRDTWIYVSMGTGYWGPPMRVGTVSELTCVELVSA